MQSVGQAGDRRTGERGACITAHGCLHICRLFLAGCTVLSCSADAGKGRLTDSVRFTVL